MAAYARLAMARLKYNARWPDGLTDLEIELACIERGGSWPDKTGNRCGAGLFEHYMRARSILWPDRYRHRWTDLMFSEFIRNDITILMGAASTQKTSHASEFILINYFTRPAKTLVILSTVTVDKLDTGVFGETKMLWENAKKRFDWLPGNLLENRHAIATDPAKVGARDMRRGIIGRACYVGGKWVGLGVLAGTKQEYVFYLCDEIQFMAPAFIGSWPNLFSNGNVKVIGSGNPNHDPDDQLGISAEPKEGWVGHVAGEKTAVWDTRFMGGRCVNLVGTDSPNLDTPEDQPERFPKLIGRKFIKRITHDWGENSPQFFSQVKGVMRIDMADKRVITRQICREHHAQEMPTWAGGDRTRVYGLDPSYGGGDLCIGIPLEFGMGEEGIVLARIMSVTVIRIDVTKADRVSPEQQVAEQVQLDLQNWGIESENCFYDPYGKGTMGFAFAHVFPNGKVPIPVDSGGPPTERPVRQDLFVDEKDGKRRLKTCREHYSKFASEAWFSVRYLIEANQLRGLPDDVMLEGCARRYDVVAGNKIEIEPKDGSSANPGYKQRNGKSPNRFDALAVAVEGARQRGLIIERLGGDVPGSGYDDYFEQEAKEWEDGIKAALLTHK